MTIPSRHTPVPNFSGPDSSSPDRHGTVRRTAGRAVRVLGLIVGAVLGIVVATIVFMQVSPVTSLRVGWAAAVGVLLLWTVAVALLVTRSAGRRRRVVLTSAYSLAVTLTMTGAATAIVTRPVIASDPPVKAGADVRFWQLPTGSRIAYTLAPAVGASDRRPPVIFLHGGPGIPGEPAATVLTGPNGLNRAGFDVYSYHQFGSGLSSRPADVRDLTVQRQVADLEAIRQTIGAPRINLVGHSWGGRLAAYYLAAHPDRVARVVFEAPGPLWEPASPFQVDPSVATVGTDADRAELARLGKTPRVLLATALLAANPQRSRELIGDGEADAIYRRILAVGPASTCRPTSATYPAGISFFANAMLSNDALRIPDPRPTLRTVRTPALVMYPECEFSIWPIIRDYRDVLPNSTLVHVRDSGHVIQADQPDVLLSTVQAFLLGRRLPLPAYTGDARPR